MSFYKNTIELFRWCFTLWNHKCPILNFSLNHDESIKCTNFISSKQFVLKVYAGSMESYHVFSSIRSRDKRFHDNETKQKTCENIIHQKSFCNQIFQCNRSHLQNNSMIKKMHRTKCLTQNSWIIFLQIWLKQKHKSQKRIIGKIPLSKGNSITVYQ